jgi:hypothetical protein
MDQQQQQIKQTTIYVYLKLNTCAIFINTIRKEDLEFQKSSLSSSVKHVTGDDLVVRAKH